MTPLSLRNYYQILIVHKKFRSILEYMRKMLAVVSLFLLPFFTVPAITYAQNLHSHVHHENHIQRRLHSINGSGVEGFVDLIQLPKKMGTHITVLGFGLVPNNQYVSLYYGNHTCKLEPYSADDVIGGIYTANIVGVGVTQANQHDNLDQINSVSIRDASTFHLLACADIHP